MPHTNTHHLTSSPHIVNVTMRALNCTPFPLIRSKPCTLSFEPTQNQWQKEEVAATAEAEQMKKKMDGHAQWQF